MCGSVSGRDMPQGQPVVQRKGYWLALEIRVDAAKMGSASVLRTRQYYHLAYMPHPSLGFSKRFAMKLLE